MRRTTCRTVLEVLFFALFMIGVEGSPARKRRIEIRQQGEETNGMAKTVTKTNNEAGQTLTETCYFWPSNPEEQTCSTTVTWTTDEDRDDDGRTDTIWPDQVSAAEAATQDVHQANPTSVVLPSVLFPTEQPSSTEHSSELAMAGPTDSAAVTTFTEPVKTQRASDLVVAVTRSTSAVPADRSTAVTDDKDEQVVIKAEENVPFPGQQLAVLPIGLGIYCSVMGAGLVVVVYMTLVRMKYRREYRRRKTGIGMGLGVAMGVGMGLDGRFAASEIRSA